ncbi:acetyltransferase, GNAT family [Lachnospiraceae bacterium KM106-2]|nr:acetyltransferase, GNAT family [Lachnospiraceae bacterium KM106-2]
MGITYRSIQKGDVESFWNLMNTLDHQTKYMMYEPGERGKNLSRLENTIDAAVRGENLLLLACEGEKLVGYLSAQRSTPRRIRHTAYLVVGILKEYRGKGIGTELFRQLDLWAKEKHITRLELTVMCPNTVAKHLYEKNGFVVEGVKKNSMILDGAYVDEYYMAKILEES